MHPEWLRVRENGVEIRVRLAPRSSREQIDGTYGDRLKIRLTAPPVGGAANQALLRFLSKRLRIRPSAIRIVQGAKERSKIVFVEAADPATLAARVAGLARPRR